MNLEEAKIPLVLFLIAAFVLTYLGVSAFTRLARKHDWLDIPNERSSHTTPVPRGAGVAVALVVLLLYSFASFPQTNWVYVVVAGAIAAIGLIDDIRTIPVLPRFIAYLLAAVVFVWASGMPFPQSLTPAPAEQLVVYALLAFFLFWSTNAFNFMDGSDGLAGMQVVASGAGWTMIGLVFGEYQMALMGMLLVGAGSAFLIFNIPPARVFLGDSGSIFLGFTLSGLPFISHSGSRSILFSTVCAIILLWLFQLDTIWTRINRAFLGRGVLLPHRDHLYQRMVDAGYTPGQVAAYFGVSAVVISVLYAWTIAGRRFAAYLLILTLIISSAGLFIMSKKRI